MNINKLISIVQKKNDLNRKRRRFWYCMNYSMNDIKDQTFYMNGYIKAQEDMKKMTKGMKKAREAIGAKFVWDNSGKIYAVKTAELYIRHTEYKRYVDAHLIENILLAGGK